MEMTADPLVLRRSARRDGEPPRCAVCGVVCARSGYGPPLCGRQVPKPNDGRGSTRPASEVSRQAIWAAKRRGQAARDEATSARQEAARQEREALRLRRIEEKRRERETARREREEAKRQEREAAEAEKRRIVMADERQAVRLASITYVPGTLRERLKARREAAERTEQR